jgi:hypothetical protein
MALFLFAQARIDAAGGLGQGQHFLFGDEVAEKLGVVGHGAEAAAHHVFEAALDGAVGLGPGHGGEAEVMDVGEAAGVVLAAGKGDLEFAAEVLDVRMAEQVLEHGVGVAGDVERLFAAYACDGAGGHVADRIAAGFAGGDVHGRQAAEHGRAVLDVDVVELDVLARGDMQDAVGIFLGQFRHHIELVCGHAAPRQLDALHAGRVPLGFGALVQIRGEGNGAALVAVMAMAVIVTLAVRAHAQTGLREHPILDLALLLEHDIGFEVVDVLAPLGIQAVAEGLLPVLGGFG